MPIDIPDLIGAVTRHITTREYRGKPARVLVATRDYDTTIDDLWDAIKTPERLARWFAPVSGDLRLGGRYQLEGNAGGDIAACEPPNHLALTWEFGGEVSWVEVRLEEAGEGTALTLEHIADVPEAFWTEYGPGATGVGWELGFLGLKQHIDKDPGAIGPDQAEAWAASPEGKAFAGACSDAWGEAAIAAGADPDAARAAAKRTTSFYAG